MRKNIRLVAISFGVALLVPYLARLPGMLVYGPEWLFSYAPSLGAVMFISIFNAIPGLALVFGAKIFPQSRLPFVLALIAAAISLSALHGGLDLASDSTAAMALVVFPILSLVPITIAWGIGVLIVTMRGRKSG